MPRKNGQFSVHTNGDDLGSQIVRILPDQHYGRPRKKIVNTIKNGEVRILTPADPEKLAAYRKEQAKLNNKTKGNRRFNTWFNS